MENIDKLIKKLAFDETEQLILYSDFYKENELISPKYKHIILELKPYAIYVSNNKPLVAFFNLKNIQNMKKFYKEIWNSQIPIIIAEEDGIVQIYNGCSLNEEQELYIIDKIKLESINRYTPFSFWNITSENFWTKYEKEFQYPKLDITLLENIKFITSILQKNNCKPFANKLILRLIFIRFLIDRGIDLDFENLNNNIEQSKKEFLEIIRSKKRLYHLFEHLKERFNGNLFDLYPDEFNLINQSDLNYLYDFLSGNLKMNSGQYSLFPLYDFSIIPVELISNIYERFLGVEKQKEDSAFYTPPYLVDYIIKENIYPFLQTNNECKVLDPSCGSGIFLVQTLRAIIEKNVDQNGYCNDDKKIVDILVNNIYGIDKNSDAIDVAIFSLYLTLLDYKNPKTLKSFKLPKLKDNNFLVYDFFDTTPKEKFKDINFDFIIGNPPWGRLEGLHIEYCNKHNYCIQNNEISRSFIYRTKDFAKKETKCIFILTSKLLYNKKSPSRDFRKWLLQSCKIDKIIELSPVRELIFKNAKCPAIIMSYSFDNNSLNNNITHITLLPNLFFKLFNIIVIERNNIKNIKQKYLLDNDWLWKTVVFGNSYDFENILMLKKNFKTLNETLKDKNIKCMTGLQLSGDSKDASEFLGKKIINAKKGIDSYHLDLEYSEIFTQKKVHRNRDHDIFKPPYVLLKKGFDIKNYKLRAVYSEDEFLYTDTITGIKGNENQKETLLSITGLLNSSLYSYLNLMLGSSAGIEREQSFTNDVLEYPFIEDENIATAVSEIQKMKNNKNKDYIISEEIINEKINNLDKYILKKFNLENNNFIDYAINIQLATIANNKNIYRKVNENDLIKYSEIFINYFKNILSDENLFFHINCTINILNKYCEFKFEILDKKPNNSIEFINNTDESKFINIFKQKKYNDLFYQYNDIIEFGDNYFTIIKLAEYKNWHPARAEIDLAYITNEIILGEND